MCHCKWSTGLLVLVMAVLLSGCASHRSPYALTSQTGESVLLAGAASARLAFAPLLSKPVVARNTYRDGLPGTIHYEVGRDYLLEAPDQIRRTPGSRIPDRSEERRVGEEG